MWSIMFFFCISTSKVLSLDEDSVLSHKSLRIVWDHCIAASRRVLCSIVPQCQSLCIKFSWFCSFHSASIPGGHSSSHGVPAVHYSFEHNNIPSPTDTTISLAIPWLKDIPSFPNSLPLQREQLYIFLYTFFSLWSFWGINPALVWLDQRADILL